MLKNARLENLTELHTIRLEPLALSSCCLRQNFWSKIANNQRNSLCKWNACSLLSRQKWSVMRGITVQSRFVETLTLTLTLNPNP